MIQQKESQQNGKRMYVFKYSKGHLNKSKANMMLKKQKIYG